MAEAVEDLESKHAEGGAKRLAKDLFGGAVGGVAQVLIGMSAKKAAVFSRCALVPSSLLCRLLRVAALKIGILTRPHKLNCKIDLDNMLTYSTRPTFW